MAAIAAIWAELMRPSTAPAGPLQAAYQRGVVGMAHGLLGAALVAILGPLWGMALRGGVALAYFAAKETGDLRRGGTFWDSIEDTAMVGLGAWFWGAAWWPLAMLGLGGAIMLSGAARHG